MRIKALTLAAILSTSALAQTVTYPTTAKVEQADTIFGERIADPYRWLENDVREDPKVREWVTAQNVVTDAYLKTLPGRDALAARMRQLYDYERTGTPRKAGSRYFFARNTGLQNQSTLWVRDGLNGAPRLLLDPNGWSQDGATALAEWTPSEDGRYLTYAVQDGGTDWRTVKLLDVATGKELPDRLEWLKFAGGVDWRKDGKGFFYSRYPEPAAGQKFQATSLNQTVYYHALGTPQSADVLVYATPDQPKLGHSVEVTDDGRWLVITTSEGTDPKHLVSVARLDGGPIKPRPLITQMANQWSLAGGIGDRLWFQTDEGAPRGRIAAVDLSGAEPTFTGVVAEQAGTLDGLTLVGNRLAAGYLSDAKSEVRLFELDGRPAGVVPLPGIGTVAGFGGKAGDSETFFAFSGYTQPTTIYRFDTATGQASPFFAPKLAFDPANFVTEQRFYLSKDGTKVPMFVVRRRDVTGPAPTLLYGYGGFNVSETPYFSPTRLAWIDAGGVLAIANLRGGGEYGRAWHEAGKRAKKQNVFDDFVAGGEYLIAQGVAKRDGLAIEGGSNGGLLVGAVVNQRPDLFAAAIPHVGVMDMLRFNRFTAGRYWVDDYGDPGVEADFRVLRAYSPYHNIAADKAYPAILVTTADTDDRVVPGHSFKYAAALQAVDLGDKPRLIRIETRAGHGSGKPVDKIVAEAADVFAFAAKWTGLPLAQSLPAADSAVQASANKGRR